MRNLDNLSMDFKKTMYYLKIHMVFYLKWDCTNKQVFVFSISYFNTQNTLKKLWNSKFY